MWTLANRKALERYVVEAFPHGGWLAGFVSNKFEAHLSMIHKEWSSSHHLRKDHVWQFGQVIVRYRFLPGNRFVEVLSVSAQTGAAQRVASRRFGRTDVLLAVILVIVSLSAFLMTFTL